MVVPDEALDHFRIVIGTRVRSLLTGKADDGAREVLLDGWQGVLAVEEGGSFEPCPFDPRVQAGGMFDYIRDESSADASRRFEEVEGAVRLGFDELGMGDAGDEAESLDDLAMEFCNRDGVG